MTTDPQKFEDPTHWAGMGQGWTDPTTGRPIFILDPAWITLQTRAREVYGDPNIHFDTSDPTQPRRLVFGDGTPLPIDATVVYHHTVEAGQPPVNFIQNTNGTVTPADANYQPIGPSYRPAGYRALPGGQYAPVNFDGTQIGPQQQLSTLPVNPAAGITGWHLANNVYTPVNARGDYYEILPGGDVVYRNAVGQEITAEQYFEVPNGLTVPGEVAATPGRDTPEVSLPEGMPELIYPAWATADDPDITNQMTAVVARLYDLFGSGTPAQSQIPAFPFRTDTGENSGIYQYDALRGGFQQIELDFNLAATTFAAAVQRSASVTEAGRAVIEHAIATFNSTAAGIEEGDWTALLKGESTLLSTVTSAVQDAANTEQTVPVNPQAAPATMPTEMAPPAQPPEGVADPSTIAQRYPGQAVPTATAASDSGMGNPLEALSGLLGQSGSQSGGSSNPLSTLADAVKPFAELATSQVPADEQATMPAGQDSSATSDTSAFTPMGGTGPASGGPAGPTSGNQAADEVAEEPPVPAAQQVNQPTAPTQSDSAVTPTTVLLPDGTTVEAPNAQAAQAAQNALDTAGPDGDAAQKAYNGTGVELPADGTNLGARVDPADMQPGDVLKWHDKTMVAVAPGLVADPLQSGVVHTIEDVLRDSEGFEGIFRPTEFDPTLSSAAAPPPRLLTESTGVEELSLFGPAAGSAAPPSVQPPPPATRTTRDERIAAGLE